MKKKIITIFIIFMFIFLGYARAASLPYINKSKIRASIAPSGQTYGDIIMENPSSETRTMKLYLEDWYYTASADGAKEFMPVSTLKNSCASWISFSPAEFSIPPFGRQRISYSIKVPEYAVGGYYAVLFFESIVGKLGAPEIDTGAGAGINLAVRIAALFYVEAEGTITRTAVVDNLKAVKDPMSNDLLIQLDFKNTGNVDITAGGTFHIIDGGGVVYARGEFNQVYTFAGDEAKLVATWKEPIPAGVYDLILTLDFGKALEEVGLGRGPIITKEAKIEIGANTQVLDVYGF